MTTKQQIKKKKIQTKFAVAVAPLNVATYKHKKVKTEELKVAKKHELRRI